MLRELRRRIGEQSYQSPPIRNLRYCLNRLKQKQLVYFDKEVGLSSGLISITDEGRKIVLQNHDEPPAIGGDKTEK